MTALIDDVAHEWVQTYVTLLEADGTEVQIGPYKQVAIEVEVIGHTTRAVMKDVVTKEPILFSAGSWWFYNGEPYKQAFTRAAQPGDKR